MKLSKKAVAMRAALGAYLRPLLAQDGTIPQLRAIVRGNKKPAFVAMDAKSVFKDLDLNVDDLTRVLTLAADEAEAEEDDMAGDEDETEEERKEREAKEKKAADEAEEEAKKKAEDEEEGKKDDRKANDAAIARVRADARQDAIREFTAIRQAEEDVRPLVGAVVAMDSAEAVYRFALDSIGVDAKDVHASALPALVNMAKERHAKPVASRLASDAASESSFSARFPTATKLKRA